jgi:BirA family biotin operon repressor/biotin-[acetyl-CoA-carboxylase] ligase
MFDPTGPAEQPQDARALDFARALQAIPLVSAIHYRAEIDSTSSFLQRLVADGDAGAEGVAVMAPALHGTVCVAGSQTAGRGRHGRSWMAPPDQSLLFSILLSAGIVPSPGLLPAAAGVAVVQAIRRLCPGLSPRLKWPNDVLLDGAKVCGILAEQTGEWIVLGVGINVFQSREDLPPGVSATSLKLSLVDKRAATEVTEEPPALAVLLAAVLEELGGLLDRDRGVDRTLARFHDYHDTIGKRVTVSGVDPSRPPVEGLAIAVDTDGALILRLDHGPTVAVHSGDATLQPVPSRPGSGPFPPGS